MRKITTRTVAHIACAAVLLGWAAAAVADEGITTSFSGYGTVGGTFTSDTQYAYHHDPTEFTGAAEQFDLGLESRLGLQAMVDFGSGLSLTAQEVARQRGSDVFSLGTEWLFVQYAPDSHWKVRLGRVALATFLLSDSRNVGYAAPWFRAPNELYGEEALQFLDGGEALWSDRLGPLAISLQAGFGTTKTTLLLSGVLDDIEVKNIYNLALTLQYKDLTFRVAQTAARSPTTIPLGPAFAVNFVLQDAFTSTGLQYDDGSAIVLAEWARRWENKVPILNEALTLSRQWYVAGGWRFGKFTPMVTYGDYLPRHSLSLTDGDFRTWSGSLRYDVMSNVDLKLEFSRPESGNGSYFVLPSTTSGKRVNVYSLGADFVF
jgi:hypothetical protein